MTCFHCGLPCFNDSTTKDSHIFCCQGCLTVYTILQSNSLNKYYSLTEQPGKQPIVVAKTDYEYLNEDEFRKHFVEFEEQNTTVVSFFIENIHCASCIWLLENLYQLQKGIVCSEVSFVHKNVRIVYKTNALKLSDIVTLLAQLGYMPTLSINSTQQKVNNKNNLQNLIKLGVASFCFGNVMLFSFPEYLSPGEVPKSFQKLFSYLNLILSFPVYFYCAKEWFTSSWISLKHKRIDINVPIVIGLTALFVISFIEITTATGVGYCDSLCGFVLFLLLGKFFQRKTFHHLSFDKDYRQYFPLSAIRLYPKKETVAVSRLNIGDQIYVRNQEIVPVDAKVIKTNISVDYSFVTGEAEPVEKKVNEQVLAGGRIVGQAATLEVLKKHEEGFLMSMWKNIRSEKEESSTINKITPVFTVVVITIALITLFYWQYHNEHTLSWYAFSSVLIVACPCALALSTPFTHGAILRILGQNKIFVRDSNVLEKMCNIQNIVFDKTGTLTTTYPKLFVTFDISSSKEKRILLSLVLQSVHPVSKTISKYIPQQKELVSFDYFQEHPGMGIEAIYQQQQILLGSISWLCQKTNNPDLLSKCEKNSTAFVIDGRIITTFAIESNFREGWQETIQKIAQNYFVHMISGDTYKDLETVTTIFPQQYTHFMLNPVGKTDYIKQTQKLLGQTAMIGDGLNDSGALLQSDVGIAIIEDNSHFSPASDVIISSENFTLLPWLFDTAKKAHKIILASFVISFVYNLIGMVFAVTGTLSPVFVAVLMPLSSITVILFTTISARIMTKSSVPD